jgi:spermidine dehydrogenase
VAVTYVRAGAAQRVWGRTCIIAGYNMMIPYLCPELPAEQRASLALLVKSPLLYTNVLLRDWQAWKRAGLGLAICPGSDHQVAMLDFPVSLGDYRFARGPDEPIVAHLEGTPLGTGSGLERRQLYREARARLLATPFSAYERSIRSQLAGMLGAAGFDPARDIEAITLNRWAHGYAWGPNPLVDPPSPDGLPHEVGRRPFGRIAIANSDAGASATLDTAIDQAYRAVEEI